MYLLSQSGLILTGYLAAGRMGAIGTCLFLGISPWATLFIAILMDLAQIPFYGLILEVTQKQVFVPERFQNWFNRQTKKIKARMQNKKILQKTRQLQNLGLVLVASVPFRGFGILSACILAFMLGYGRIFSTLLIGAGSLISSTILVCALFFPGRYLGVF